MHSVSCLSSFVVDRFALVVMTNSFVAIVLR